MAKLKLGPIADEKPVRVTAELPASVHRDLLAYVEVLGRETGQVVEPAQLVAPMLVRFMATDRAFANARKKLAATKIKATDDGSSVERPEGEPRSGNA